MASEFFGRQRECRFYTAGCGNKMAISVTGRRAVNELGGPVIPGRGRPLESAHEVKYLSPFYINNMLIQAYHILSLMSCQIGYFTVGFMFYQQLLHFRK